jgi:sulfite exporter TauE/SafE
MIFLWLAFTLGLTGSLHCMGMCGPLVVGACNRQTLDSTSLFLNILQYNFGRILTYMILGLLIGLFSHVVLLSGFQKIISISSGLILLLIALSTINIDTILTNNWFTNKLYKLTTRATTFFYRSFQKPNIILLGLLNGILPCGLVYVALAGALTTGNAFSGSMFMLFFGIGTVPLLMVSTYFGKSIKSKFPGLYQKVLPVMTAVLGVVMIVRGIIINMPISINFLEALANPILCH